MGLIPLSIATTESKISPHPDSKNSSAPYNSRPLILSFSIDTGGSISSARDDLTTMPGNSFVHTGDLDSKKAPKARAVHLLGNEGANVKFTDMSGMIGQISSNLLDEITPYQRIKLQLGYDLAF